MASMHEEEHAWGEGGWRAPYLIVHQQLGAFEVAGGHPDVVFLSGMVKFSQTPVDETQLVE